MQDASNTSEYPAWELESEITATLENLTAVLHRRGLYPYEVRVHSPGSKQYQESYSGASRHVAASPALDGNGPIRLMVRDRAAPIICNPDVELTDEQLAKLKIGGEVFEYGPKGLTSREPK